MGGNLPEHSDGPIKVLKPKRKESQTWCGHLLPALFAVQRSNGIRKMPSAWAYPCGASSTTKQ